MKPLYPLLALSLAIGLPARAQYTLTLQPGPGAGIDASVHTLDSNASSGNDPNFIANAWTAGGVLIQRSLLQFDLSQFHTGTTIQSATLFLYCNTTSTHSQLHSSWTGSPYPLSNQSYLQRITGNWNENTVTWNNQPAVDSTHQVTVPTTISQTQDIALDVTQLVKDMVAAPASSHGFMFRLQTEATYRSMIFASSDNADPTKWPKLMITYTPPLGIAPITPSGPKVNIFPNPALETLWMDFDNSNGETVTVRLLDVMGRVLNTIANQPALQQERISFDLSTMKAGCYFVEAIGSKTGRSVTKVQVN